MKRVLILLGALIVVSALFFVYMKLMRLELRDFVRTPEGVLDDTIYAAQQGDLKGFKRGFTNEIREHMDRMSDSNMNRQSNVMGAGESEDLFWTWETLMRRMSREGGFEVLPNSTKFLDYMIEGKARIEIGFYDKDSRQDRQRNYTLFRSSGVWRIDLKSNPDFVKAYRQSVKELRSGGSRESDTPDFDEGFH